MRWDLVAFFIVVLTGWIVVGFAITVVLTGVPDMDDCTVPENRPWCDCSPKCFGPGKECAPIAGWNCTFNQTKFNELWDVQV